MAATTPHTHTITRNITTLTHPYDLILSRIHASLGNTTLLPPLQSLAKTSTPLEPYIASVVGPHDFIIFQKYDWHPLLASPGQNSPGLKACRIIFGNPLVAKTMVREDVKAGLFAPVSMLVQEIENGGGVSVMWDLPSSLINWAGTVKGEKGEALEKASKVLDGKMKRFIEDLGTAEEEWEGVIREWKENGGGKGREEL
ncbi:uncharacterized protein AB675_4106 [Cyphellophora attinorum]|uniref:DUF302 domain-containing protein n=1 Tax=Cyphellophora attinorum TaxID=1664694 RepID=A0A0N1H7D5_9EURO|nr:uncharacterized protein AB675_4106 [Phialophora attinorum]KPI38563.1 hypothetical protein AB675_4106 [Phialophora attinorum]